MKTNKQGTIITVIVLLVFTCLAGYLFTTTKAAPVEEVKLNTSDIYVAINAERAKHGLIALNVDTRLETSACAKARDMDEKEYWAHDAPDGTTPWHFFDEVGYDYAEAGENLYAGVDNNANNLVKAWIKSPEHEKNILGNYTEMGLCILKTNRVDGNSIKNLVVNHFVREN